MKMTSNASNPPHLDCHLTIARAKNITCSKNDRLFIRYHLSTSDNMRSARLETREAASASDPSWNDHVHLECHGSAEDLGRQKVVFELRSRRGWGRSSSLLGRGEVAWGDALASTPDMSMERWVVMDREGKVGEGEIAMLLVGMKVGVPEKVGRRRIRCRRSLSECECEHGGCLGAEEDVFAFAALLVDVC
ncbi:hypothetical protein QJS10_CPA06g02051 [Acorus calamus]|uniref:C2 domain-containing protein n=1 Tax=Acorus calamus TaxID=4465 RepID=A0AAV9ENZ5_ACOCL|nr:hypothetical protein QJS10_CPA06g02051 [Acorus calamus]